MVPRILRPCQSAVVCSDVETDALNELLAEGLKLAVVAPYRHQTQVKLLSHLALLLDLGLLDALDEIHGFLLLIHMKDKFFAEPVPVLMLAPSEFHAVHLHFKGL